MKFQKFQLPEEELANAADRVQTQATRVQRKAEQFFRPKTIAILFSVVIVLLAAVSVVVVIKEKRVPKAQGETTTEAVEALVGAPVQTNGVSFLFAFTDNDEKTIRLITVLHADPDAGNFTVRYVSPQVKSNVNNLEDTLQAHYLQGGGSELLWATGERLGMTIDRYVFFDSENLLAIAKMLGDHEVTVDEEIRSRDNGIAYIIEKGRQRMIPDTLRKYFVGLSKSVYNGGEARMTKLLSYLLSKLLFDQPEADANERLTKFFSNTTNNISVVDISDYAAALPIYLDGKVATEVICEGVF